MMIQKYLDIYSCNMAPPKELDGVLLFVQLVVILGRIITSVPVKHKLPVVQPADPTLLLHDSQVSFLTQKINIKVKFDGCRHFYIYSNQSLMIFALTCFSLPFSHCLSLSPCK